MKYLYQPQTILLLVIIIIIIVFFIVRTNVLSQKEERKMIEEPGWIDHSLYPELQILIDNKNEIKKELDEIIKMKKWNKWGDNYSDTPQFTSMTQEEIKNKISDTTQICDEKSWKIFGLILNEEMLPGTKECPVTMSLLEKIGLKNIVNAGFSCLEAGATTKRHRDLNKSFYRCHIPLIIPEGNCYLEVNNVKKKWNKNQSLVFDDTQYHNAWNYTDYNRFILIVDLKRK